MSAQIETGKVTERRRLRFHSLDDLAAEIDRIVAADEAGRLRTSGNWTAGQTLGHLASWINYGWDGYPFPTPPWFVRVFLKFMRKKYLRDGMPAGVKIPNADGGTYGTERLSTADGAERLRSAVHRLKSGEEPRHHSPALGPMSREERIALNLRHSELHLSFLHPGN